MARDDRASPQLVAVRVDVRFTRRVVAGPALDEVRLVGMPKHNEGRPVVNGTGVAGDLPAAFQKRLDRRFVIGRLR